MDVVVSGNVNLDLTLRTNLTGLILNTRKSNGQLALAELIGILEYLLELLVLCYLSNSNIVLTVGSIILGAYGEVWVLSWKIGSNLTSIEAIILGQSLNGLLELFKSAL